MNLRIARKIWWSRRWSRYRADTLERAQVRFLRSMRLSPKQCEHDYSDWDPPRALVTLDEVGKAVGR